MPDPVRFRREQVPAEVRGTWGLAVLFVLLAVAFGLRSWWTPAPDGLLVTVDGEVAAPGTYLVDPPTLAAAVEAAGGDASGLPETPLFAGDGVWVAPDGARVVPHGNPLLVALPVDVNVHGTDALTAVPGLGTRHAEALVAHREAHGPFYALDDLVAVPGLDEARLAELAPFLTVGEVGPRPAIDVNRAPASVLEQLPGVGPVLASRIVSERETHGPFVDLDDLRRVRGVGPALVARLREADVEVTP